MELLVPRDRVEEIVQNAGLTDFDLAGAVDASYMAFAAADVDDEFVPYCARHRSSGQWETGVGLYDPITNTLVRFSDFRNSNGLQAKIDFAVGVVDVWIDLIADKTPMYDADSDDIHFDGSVYAAADMFVGDDLTVGGDTTFGAIAYTWPASQAANRYLKTNGSGVLSWASILESLALTDLSDVTITSQATGQILRASSNTDWANTTATYPNTVVAGALLHGSATNVIGGLGIGAANTVLTSSGTLPQWSSSLNISGTLDTGGDITITKASGQTLAVTLTQTGVASWRMRNIATSGALTLSDASGTYVTVTPVSGAVSMSGTVTLTTGTAATLTIGAHLTGTSYNSSSNVTIATDAASANTAGTIVARDGSGNFAAGTITATFVGSITGNADTATALLNTRTIWGQNFNGTANVTGALSAVTTIAASDNLTITKASGSTPAVALVQTSVTTWTIQNTATSGQFRIAQTAGTSFSLDLTTHAATLGGALAITGALTGVTTITTSGAINGQTISATANFTGTVVVASTLTTTGQHIGNKSGGDINTTFYAVAAVPGYAWNATGSGVDAKVWDLIATGNTLLGRTSADAGGSNATWLTVTRSGTTVASVALGGTAATVAGTFSVAGASITLAPAGGDGTININVGSGGNSVLSLAQASNATWLVKSTATTGQFLIGESGVGNWLTIAKTTGAVALAGILAVSGASIALGTHDPFSRGYAKLLSVNASSGNGAIEINSATGSGAFLDMGVNGVRLASLYNDVASTDLTTTTALPLRFGTNNAINLTIASGGAITMSSTLNVTGFTTLTAGSRTVTGAAPTPDATISGVQTWYASNQIFHSFIDSTRSANGRIHEWYWTGGTFAGRFPNDAYGGATSWLTVVGTSASITSVGISGTAINFTGAATFNTGLVINGAPAAQAGAIYKSGTVGLGMIGITGSSYDFAVLNPAFSQFIITVPTGTLNVVFGGTGSFGGTLDTTGNITITKASGNAVALRLAQSSVVAWEVENIATTGSFSVTEVGVNNWLVIAKTTGAAQFNGLLTAGAGLTIASGQVLKVGNTAAVGVALVSSHTITVKDDAGTTYRLMALV